MIEIPIIGLAFYTFGIFALGATIGAAIGGAVTIAYFKKESGESKSRN